MLLILSENWTLTDGRSLNDLVRWAREAEDAGFDAVMLSEHIVLGPDAGADGVMANLRAYAMPGNQDPATPWPSSLMLLSAVAAATTRIRLVASAVIAPLRHPLLLARELGTLDLLCGGQRAHGAVLRRLVRHGHGFHPLGRPSGDDLDAVAAAMAAAGRSSDELEMVGGVRAVFPDDDSCADIAQAMEVIPEQWARGFGTFCVKPSQFIDDQAQMGAFCRDVVRRADALV
jgi:alkanesulfonate monooxygenase SsuD/methylene tetrahydromethanopterin reductase-like flavin-dependent oxidoreductase (luciferase family)